MMKWPQYITGLQMLSPFPGRNCHRKIADVGQFREIVTLFEITNDPWGFALHAFCSFCHRRFRCDGHFIIDW